MMFQRHKEWRLRREAERRYQMGFADALSCIPISADRIARTANNMAYVAGHKRGADVRREAVAGRAAPLDGTGRTLEVEEHIQGAPARVVEVDLPDLPEETWERIRDAWLEHFA